MARGSISSSTANSLWQLGSRLLVSHRRRHRPGSYRPQRAYQIELDGPSMGKLKADEERLAPAADTTPATGKPPTRATI